MVQEINFFAEDPGRYERFQQHCIAKNIIDDVIDEILERHSDVLKEREGEESDLSRLVAGLCFGKAHKTFHAIIRLCALGFGEDAAILLRSNINLLINIYFILKNNDPLERCKEFIDYSINERKKYFDSAHERKQPVWMKNISEEDFEQIKKRAKKWESKIKTRAESMGNSAFVLHYRQGYQLYSSLEHADVMVLSGYIQDENETSLLINSGPSDDYVSLVLAHNFLVMADLLVAAMNYFGIQRLDINEKLTDAWKGFNREGIEKQ